MRLQMKPRSCKRCFNSYQEPITLMMGSCSYRLRASSYEPGNRAGPVGGTNFVFCSYGKFNPGYKDEKCPKGHQNTRGTAFRPVSDLTSHAQLKMFRPGIRAGVFIWEEFEKFPARLPRSQSVYTVPISPFKCLRYVMPISFPGTHY